MKVPAICNSVTKITHVLLLSLLFAVKVMSDVSGGPGKPITPYKRGDTTYYKDTVQNMMEYASKNKYILHIPFSEREDLIEKREGIGIAYIKSGKIKGNVHFAFTGKDKKGDSIKVDFSQVKEFEVLGKDGDLLVLEIDQFPAISTEELLSKKPTYLELRAKYRKSVKIWLQPRTKNGSELYLVSTKGDAENAPIVAIEDIAVGSSVTLHEDRRDPRVYWWAIYSVITDPAYPYRLITKK